MQQYTLTLSKKIEWLKALYFLTKVMHKSGWSSKFDTLPLEDPNNFEPYVGVSITMKRGKGLLTAYYSENEEINRIEVKGKFKKKNIQTIERELNEKLAQLDPTFQLPIEFRERICKIQK